MSTAHAELVRHGGNLDAAMRVFNTVSSWIDLSTGINPAVYPVPALSDKAWNRLPEASAVEALRISAAEYFGLQSVDYLIEAPGTQAILQVLPLIIRAKHVAIVSPTYNEHARCWQRSGANVTEISSLHVIPESADVVVVVNPNNPDGTCYSPTELLSVADMMSRKKGLLIVDEAFCDVIPDRSLAPHVRHAGLLVLRSFGKFFGLAGVRLGFALSSKYLIDEIKSHLGPWAVSGPALEIGRFAYEDADWIAYTRSRLAADSQRLRLLLERSGSRVIGGTDLFLLIENFDSEGLWTHLAEHGILTRSFDYNPNWIRLGLANSDADWDVLKSALEEWAS